MREKNEPIIMYMKVCIKLQINYQKSLIVYCVLITVTDSSNGHSLSTQLTWFGPFFLGTGPFTNNPRPFTGPLAIRRGRVVSSGRGSRRVLVLVPQQ